MDLVLKSIEFVEKHKRYPTQGDLNRLGFTRAQVRTQFESLGGLHDFLSESCQDHIFDIKRHDATIKVKKKKTYILSSATTGAEIHPGFLNNLLVMKEHYDAELVVGPVFGDDKNVVTIDPALAQFPLILEDYEFNSNVFSLGVHSKARTVEPVGKLGRLAQKEGTFITFSPKQRLKCVPTGVGKLPVVLTSTGSLTLPNYTSKNIIIDSAARLAEMDHIIGAVVLELDEDEVFHFRHVQADAYGNFCDLGLFFTNGNIGRMAPHLVMGDWHTGYTNPVVRETTFQMIKELNVPVIVGHDMYDGMSVNHHEAGKRVLQARKAKAGQLKLSEELDAFAKELMVFQQFNAKLIIVKSNHDEFLDRYLDKSAFVKHPYNYEEANTLVNAMFEGHDPLEYAMQSRMPNMDNIVFLKRDESYTLAGIEIGQHGDVVGNGGRGTVAGMERSFFKCVSGHTHTPEILRGAYCVGTSTDTNPHYGRGSTSWMNTHCLVYPNGQRQLINIINGKWRLER